MSRSRSSTAALFIIIIAAVISPPALAADTTIPDYSMKPRSEVPVEFTWKLEDLYPDYDAWAKDKEALGALVGRIDAAAAGWTESAAKMADMYDLADEIYRKGSRLFSYASFLSDGDMTESKYQVMKGELQSIFVQIGVKLAFMNPDILKMDEGALAAFIKAEPRLAPYRFGIEQTLRSRSHILPEDQQQIVSRTRLFTNAPGKASSMLNDVDIPPSEVTLSDGTVAALNTANYLRHRSSKEPADRTLVMRTFWTNHKKYENTFAALLDGEMKQHLFSAQTQKYRDCLEARLFDDAIDTLVYFQLVRSVNDHLDLFHRYLKLKGKLQGLDTMRYEDIYGPAVKAVEKTYTWEDSRAIIAAALKPLGADYASILAQAYAGRWIDVYPNRGKQSGAYSGGVYGVHPYIKLNYDGQYDALSTAAHELGHTAHSYFANKSQHHWNAGYPTFLAEIASTFNETLLLRHLLKSEKDDLFKLFILDSYLDGVRGTIYRQTLFAEFELAMHRRVEEGKTLTPDWLSQTYLEITRRYYGHDKGVLRVDDYIQNEWSAIPHFYRNYYVFQYSTGMIASMALAENALKDKKSVERYLDLLKAGGSDYPLPLLKKAGVDMMTAAPAEAAFENVATLLGEMESIVARLEKQKKL